MIRTSEKFLVNLKMHKLPAYKIAQEADVNPVVLSKLINGIEPLRPKDPRIVAVGKVLGLKASECFQDEEQPSEEPLVGTSPERREG